MNFKSTLPVSVLGTNYNLKQLAKDCIKLYVAGGYTPNTIKTDFVSFDTTKLSQWLSGVSSAAQIRTAIGVYTPAFIDAINDLASKAKADEYGTPFTSVDRPSHTYRMTIFLFAYNADGSDFAPGGKESSGYNLGNLHP